MRRDVVPRPQRRRDTDAPKRPTDGGEPAPVVVPELPVRAVHALLVADVVLRDAVLAERGDGVAGRVAGDAEMALQQRLGLCDGFVRGGGRAALVVVAAHEDEELGALGLVGPADVAVRVEEDAEGLFRVVLLGDAAGDEVPEARGLEVFVGVPDVYRHDVDGGPLGEGGEVVCDVGEGLACEC